GDQRPPGAVPVAMGRCDAWAAAGHAGPGAAAGRCASGRRCADRRARRGRPAESGAPPRRRGPRTGEAGPQPRGAGRLREHACAGGPLPGPGGVSMATTLSSPPTPPVSPAELAERIAAFNEVTGRLQGTLEALRREVVRLQEELRDANEQLQRSKRLAALGQMAAGIAHEVRNPLGSIRLYARMLEQDLADRPAERAIASKIAAAVHGLDCVVGDVLNFSRELKVRPQETEPEAILDRALEACWTADAAAAQRIRVVRREASGGVSARLVCDPVLMHQALVNLIRNALEA